MTNLITLITISGTTIVWIALAIIILFSFVSFFRRDTEYVDEQLNEEDVKFRSKRVLTFDIENNTGEEIELDLCHLDENDKRYSFKTSSHCDYKMLMDYLKAYSFNVFSTRVNYKYDNWKDDVIYHIENTPFSVSKRPVLIGFHNFNKNQYQRNIIDSPDRYNFDYFNSLKVVLKPNDKKDITLLISDENYLANSEYKPAKCALLLKNNSDVTERVKLFNREYYEGINEIGKIEIKSLFKEVNYEEVMKCFECKPLIAKELKMFIGKNNSQSKFLLNFDEHMVGEYISEKQYNADVLDVELKDDSYIATFEIDLEPNSEIFISFK